MCYNLNKKCAMCSKEMGSELNFCAEGMRGNICIITPLNQNQVTFNVRSSKPRGGSRTYINIKAFITAVTKMDVCDNCQKDAQMTSDEHENGFRDVVAALKTYSTLFDSAQIHALTSSSKDKK